MRTCARQVQKNKVMKENGERGAVVLSRLRCPDSGLRCGVDFIGGDAWMNAMYGDIFRLLMVQSELAGARMASRNSSCIHALRCVTVVGTCGASSGALRRGCCYDVW